VFEDVVLARQEYVDRIHSDSDQLCIHNMGLVDEHNRVNFYEGVVRVVDTRGEELVRYHPGDYLEHVREHVEPWTYLKFPYLAAFGWHGLVEGQTSGVYRATPLARLNVADGMATPLAQEQYERFFTLLGGKPVCSTLATHWARVIEILYAAERFAELANDPETAGPEFRTIVGDVVGEGVGLVEAPRGTLTHHYVTDGEGIIRRANLIVGTTNNHAAICMSIKRAAESVIRPGVAPTEGVLNRVEMAFRAYDPCLGCATHTIPGQMNLRVHVYDAEGRLADRFERC
jgi:F420-non-reducing hydrogenase large subunit